ncbi:hypothetical protein PsorP6_013258 [Peronosclerospora sorghi]|uniref:Uncharacterized protein n=1 Tax=Peronosclerospora sorghi TaxID=230839 RepID=A0ACC0WIQ9_9STRA|nr:hypothetical protein PsorP6_013258 [Peronosclerospora sorghi]
MVALKIAMILIYRNDTYFPPHSYGFYMFTGKPAKLNDEEASISRLFGEEESLSTLRESVLKHFGHEESLSPLDKEEAWENFDKLFHLPRNPDLLQKISVLSDGLENQQVMMVLAETDPDQLLDRLSDRYGEVSLLVALVAEGKRKDAPQYAIALKAMQMKRLVEMGITPKDLVNELEFVRKNVREHFLEKKHIRYDFDSLDQFLEAYNEGKDVSEQVTLLQALRASGTWESNKALLKYLESRRYSSHVAMDAYRELDAELARERRNVVDAGEEQ